MASQARPDPYYSRRAAEYEEIYSKPERQADLAVLRQRILQLFSDLHVLELACGTGYWTERIAPAAASVLATDISPEMLQVAQAKAYPPGRVSFQLLDAYDADAVGGRFGAVFAGFWWSHVPLERLPRFLSGLQRSLGSGARFAFLDNRHVPGSSTPICRRDGSGNTFQQRTLRDGSTFEVLKNFPAAREVRQALAAVAEEIELLELPFYWLAWGRFSGSGASG
jgi:SAM-dependent methyltransferase